MANKHMTDFGLYVIITKPSLPYTRIAEICVEQGIGMLQLREKQLSDKELLRIAKEIKSITKNSTTKFVVNDRPDIAVLSDADVLHLGQDDLSVEEARKIVGSMPIGLSTHSIAQAKEALTKTPAYIGFGPVYPTTTKAMPDPTVGAELLRQTVELAEIPVVAIGGIFPSNLNTIKNVGAKNYSLVRYLMETQHLAERIAECRQLFNN